MAPPFQRLTVEEFSQLLKRFPFRRAINGVHMHHTWRPDHRAYLGHESIVRMWRYHTRDNGWSDLAQHLTLAPDGTLWTGRDWNLPPASASGHNGNPQVGPFMFEMIGDFDEGRDRFEGPQREAALQVITLVQQRFGLLPETLRFHNQMSKKSCPGSAISYEEVLAEVRKRHHEPLAPPVASARDAPFPAHARAGSDAVERALDSLQQNPPWADPWDAEPDEEGEAEPQDGEGPEPRARKALTPEVMERLRPHLINLNQGRFSAEGRYKTTAEDVDAIFQEHLVRELERLRPGEKLHLVFYAHGGLVSESNALSGAARHIPWWKKNRVYPLYFIWETGFFETVRQLLTRGRAATRDLWDYTTDPLLEATARALSGPVIWGGMKASAAQAVEPEVGGARHVARRLKELCEAHGQHLALHAVGHSAGAIFHAHFLPCSLELGVPAFQSVHLMAPAVRTDVFKAKLGPYLGQQPRIERLTVYTLNKERELADHCAQLYRKSLLYLIHTALEPEPKTPLLGLESSLRADPALRQLFGLGGAARGPHEVLWSPTPDTTGRGATLATSHGNFDTDGATMNSVLRRVLGLEDSSPIAEFPPEDGARTLNAWEGQVDWPEELPFLLENLPLPPVPLPPTPTPPSPTPGPSVGRKRALCVGIDDYPTAPLAGCVADAKLWSKTLLQQGFESVRVLQNAEATRGTILQELRGLLARSATGDVVVFQFSGHGTQVPDVNADEGSQDSPLDEALCSYDFSRGRFVTDDDLGEVLAQAPRGVNVTCFIDCCHSGTISRFGVGSASRGAHADGARPRFLQASPQMKQAHLEFRRGLGQPRAFGQRGPETMRQVLFSACRSTELAYESNGQGEFTLRATQLLRSAPAGMTHEEFQRRITEAFGPRPRQHPELDCAPPARARPLLQPLADTPGASRAVGARAGSATVASVLRALADQLEKDEGAAGS